MNLEKHDADLMKRHFTTAFYLAKHEKPYADFVGLNELQQKNYGDHGDATRHYNNDKQASNFIHYIAKAERDRILKDINKCEVIAVAVDGATDSANTEQELFYVVYFDENFNAKETYIKIVNIKGRATANGLSECFFETFKELGIDVHAKCVQLATDGPSVMKNMYANVKAKIDWVLHFHCINHRLELAVKDAVKDIPLQSEVHTLLDGVYHFYDNSNLQQRILQDTAHALGVNLLSHPTAKGTRWMAHQERALTAMERNYRATTTQLHECNADKTQRTETRAKALGLRDKLINADIVTYMFAVLKVVLSIVSCLSCILRSNTSDVSIDTVVNTIRRTKHKLNSFNCQEGVTRFRKEKIENGVYQDVVLKDKTTGLRKLDPNTDQVIKQGERLITNLKKTMTVRFGPLGDGNIGECPEMSLFTVFDPCNLPVDENDNVKLYGLDEISKLCEHFRQLIINHGYDPDQIGDERITLWEYVVSVFKTTNQEGRTVKKFWPKILRRKGNSPELRNILFLVKILIVLIFSTSCVERGFSLMNRVKSDWRAKLGPDALDDLMLLALSEKSVSSFDPEPAIKLWWQDTNKRRRLVDAYGPRTQKGHTSSSTKEFVEIDLLDESSDRD